ncbi:uncharacterized protein LOC125215687 isoform X2 [Salvia hispanica]|uniref:uncharacterized protein LOC125215687 isoform X2 n=1 Tax=Salvia hispanica TaxID=49212 RepID=UPI002009A019|nr:uncharacterized protein LOC125215687 isoform X2 [Salvia hispanica]
MPETSSAKFPSDNLFPSLISDIKAYNGADPLLPWLRGIKKLKEVLPPQLLKEKLPRFLQKCAETFMNDRRYSNDMRYLRVWLQLMDFVEEPRAVLKTMEANRIGLKKSVFYQAYALYYEKLKKFDAAEKIYHLGVQNLAEPADELHKSYEQFLHRLERAKNKRVQGGKTSKGRLNHNEARSCKEKLHVKESNHTSNSGGLDEELYRKVVLSDSRVEGQDENKKLCSDDTVVVRFVDTAIVGKSNAEDARHHGLVEPTINTKEAMNAINSMFREPLEPSISGRSRRNKSSIGNNAENGFSVYSDESLESKQNSPEVPSLPQLTPPDTNQPLGESFEIYVDGEETGDVKEMANGKGIPARDTNPVDISISHATVFARPNDHPSALKDPNYRRPIREDTAVYRFVGSTISDEPEVENAWHHGLVDPTINLKEAMQDINSMFGKPIEFTRKRRPRKHVESPEVKDHSGGFLILPDDDDEPEDTKPNPASGFFGKPMASKCNRDQSRNKMPEDMNNHSGFLILPDDEEDIQQESSLPSSSTRNNSDLFEQTVCTKEAMDEINKLFAMPMDF